MGEKKIHLDHTVDLCNSVIPLKHQVNFVYVTTSFKYRQAKHWQSFDTGSGGTKTFGRLPTDTARVLSRLVQFCMRFKKC